MKFVQPPILPTLGLFALTGLLAGFVPISTVGPEIVLSPKDAPAPLTHSLRGSVVVYSVEEGDQCINPSKNNIGEGTPVFIKNSDRQIVATGALGKGKPAPLQPGSTIMTCNFPLTVDQVPQIESYIIHVGGREGLSYTTQQLQNKNWQLELTLIESPLQSTKSASAQPTQ